MDKVWPYLVILLMLMLSAYFSGSEISFNASNKLRLKKAAENNEKTAKIAYKISENFTPSLSAILIGNNLANIAASSVTTIITMNLLSGLNMQNSDGLASTIATTIMTTIILIFGEIVPKILAKQHADTVVRWVAIPTKILTIILYPIVFIIMLFLRLLRLIWGKDKADDAPTVTEEELSSIIDTAQAEGVVDEDKSELLQSTLEFHETTVEEIMTPRIDMVTIDIDDDKDEILKAIDNAHFSRIPVYEDSIDNIIGILSLNHYYKTLDQGQDVDIRSLLREPIYFHKTMRLPAALKQMRDKKTHIAIVIDEFGGTLGLVTMEDILEEIVGDIWDESDEIVTMLTKTGDNTYEVNGDMNIDDFFEQIEFTPHDFECEYSTVGGWAIEQLNADPHVGDSFAYENLFLVVSEMDDLRVTKLTVVVKAVEEDTEDE